MVFKETILTGAFLIEQEPIEDNRGWFARSFCKNEFADRGLCFEFVQNSISFNLKKGTIRGLHYQRAPYEEIKAVQCIAGRIYDVIVDIRTDSPTYLKWLAVELCADDGTMLYIPQGFAHGYQTLAENTKVFYQMSEFYRNGQEGGIRWDDKRLNIPWPVKDEIVMSERDKKLEGVKNLCRGSV